MATRPAYPVHEPAAVGRAIRRARLARGWTQQQLADLLRTNRHAIIALEEGRQTKAVTQMFDTLAFLDLELLIQEREQ